MIGVTACRCRWPDNWHVCTSSCWRSRLRYQTGSGRRSQGRFAVLVITCWCRSADAEQVERLGEGRVGGLPEPGGDAVVSGVAEDVDREVAQGPCSPGRARCGPSWRARRRWCLSRGATAELPVTRQGEPAAGHGNVIRLPDHRSCLAVHLRRPVTIAAEASSGRTHPDESPPTQLKITIPANSRGGGGSGFLGKSWLVDGRFAVRATCWRAVAPCPPGARARTRAAGQSVRTRRGPLHRAGSARGGPPGCLSPRRTASSRRSAAGDAVAPAE